MLSAEGMLPDLFCFCLTLHKFWTVTSEWLSAFFREILAICVCSAGTFELPYDTQADPHIAMLAAKRLNLLSWKCTHPPCFTDWLKKKNVFYYTNGKPVFA